VRVGSELVFLTGVSIIRFLWLKGFKQFFETRNIEKSRVLREPAICRLRSGCGTR
jgi:hypothetical protein